VMFCMNLVHEILSAVFPGAAMGFLRLQLSENNINAKFE
jgi:hypothetical protein